MTAWSFTIYRPPVMCWSGSPGARSRRSRPTAATPPPPSACSTSPRTPPIWWRTPMPGPRSCGCTGFRGDYGAAVGAQARWGRWQDGIGVGPAEREVLGRLDAALRARLAAFGTGPGRYGLIHADTRLANLLVDDGRVSVIDFDD